MNTYRCMQCGFLNWETADQCKRCRLPNSADHQPQFSPQPPMPNTMVSATPQTAVQTQYVQPQYVQPQYFQPQNYQTPNYQVPPQFQGQQRQTHSPYNNAPSANYEAGYQTGTNNTYFENDAKVERAKMQVKTGWITGTVWASLLALVTIFLAFMPMMIGGRQDPALKGLDSGSVAMVSRIMTGIMLLLTFLIGGLSYGIKQNSSACAIILTIISGLGVFSSLAEKNLVSTAFGILFFVIFCFSFAGISTLKRHGQIE